uniref:Claudin-23 n=1 Tax=Pogona vitticeps TaxID=103695 RepID=A0A6J0SGH5_9SAUR
MRTPTPMIVGIVLGPCGFVLNLTSTLAPSWRNVSQIEGKPFDLIEHQGLWQLCDEFQGSSTTNCRNVEDTLGYFSQLPVQVAKGLMPASLVVIGVGVVVTSLGVRCWQDRPHYLLAGLGGLLLFLSGLLSLIAVSWYNYELYNLPAPARSTRELGYCLVLGYLGSCLEIIGGFSLTFSFDQCCKERKLKKAAMDYAYPPSNQQGSTTVAAISPTVDSRDFQMYHRNPGPRSYTNSLDVLEDERAFRGVSLPCDSDL